MLGGEQHRHVDPARRSTEELHRRWKRCPGFEELAESVGRTDEDDPRPRPDAELLPGRVLE